jgi:putative zinc finger/helix-turn-helix YgiT family protein
MKCTECGKPMLRGQVAHEFVVSGVRVVGNVPAWTCSGCGEQRLEHDTLAGLELAAAHALGQAGVCTGESFRFMRKALGLRAVDLGELIDIEPETISRWETGKRPVEVRAFALLADLVADRFAGRNDTERRLKKLATKSELPPVLNIELPRSA